MLRCMRARQAWRWGLLASLTLLAGGSSAFGQGYGVPYHAAPVGYYGHPQPYYCPPHPGYLAPGMPAYPPPGAPSAEPQDVEPPSVMDQTAPTAAPSPTPALATAFTQATGGGGGVAVPNTYIDPAQVFTHFRLRFDAAWDNPFPDRAEFFYAKCGCFRNPQLAGALTDPEAAGPPLPETSVDYQDIRSYLEVAATPNLSGFVEVPVRFINPVVNDNEQGLGDILFGGKAVLLTNGEDFVTFQLTTYAPSGDAGEGLGTDHWSLEPGLLWYEQWSDRLSFYGETRLWIPIDGSDFAGEVIRYGLGTGYDLAYRNRGDERLTALAEVVGWTVLDGFKSNATEGRLDAEGDDIINLKLGLRYTLGQGSFAASWGHGLSSAVWYENIFRLEYRRAF